MSLAKPYPAAPTTKEPRPLHRRLLASLAGFALLAAGALMLILPGPGIAVMLMGLAVLSKEYPWAARILLRLKALWQKALGYLRARVAKNPNNKNALKDLS